MASTFQISLGSSRADAEGALATIELVAKNLELELNPSKTEIEELPEVIEPPWLTDVRAMQLRPDDSAQRFDLLALFNTALNSLRRYPTEPVLKYVVKQTLGADIHGDNWDIYESLLCHTIVADVATLPLVTQILLQYHNRQGYGINEQRIRDTLSEIIQYHSKLNHGFEVAWALWLSSLLSIQIPEATGIAISAMEDTAVVLAALDAREKGWLNTLDTSRWERMMTLEELYSENWLIAYEPIIHGWLCPTSGNYLSDDDLFGTLAARGVSFYDATKDQPIYWTIYGG